jgi:hypothetical protein
VLIALGNREKRFCTSDLCAREREEESAKATLSAISCEHFTLKHTQQKAAHGSREISSLARTTTIYTYCGTLCTSAFCFYFHKLRCVLAGDESAFIPWCARSLALQLLLCAPAVEYKHTHTVQTQQTTRAEMRISRESGLPRWLAGNCIFCLDVRTSRLSGAPSARSTQYPPRDSKTSEREREWNGILRVREESLILFLAGRCLGSAAY